MGSTAGTKVVVCAGDWLTGIGSAASRDALLPGPARWRPRMTCPRCQHENPAGMRFCGQCAAPLASVCPSCGAANPTENKFCGQCAAPLDRSTQPRFSSPDANTRRHLAEKILTSKGALEGERNQVTVLFADVAGVRTLADIPLGTGCPTGGSAADLNLIPPRSSSMLDFTRCSHSHPVLPH